MLAIGGDRFPAGNALAMFAVVREHSRKIRLANARIEYFPNGCWTHGKRKETKTRLRFRNSTLFLFQWNISDYFNQNQDKLSQTVTEDQTVLPDFPGTMNIPHFDKLWMCLFARLGDLCVDSRPAVRKSAGQTLFSTISAHGSLLNPPTWQAVLWQVLFPLLDKVRNFSSSASSEKVDTTGNILIHHSRNTAQKQWAETQVLTLSGVSRVFNTKRQMLQSLGDFSRAWSLLLEFIENAALSKSNEVSLAALKSFQEILYNNKPDERDDPSYGRATTDHENTIDNDDASIWDVSHRFPFR